MHVIVQNRMCVVMLAWSICQLATPDGAVLHLVVERVDACTVQCSMLLQAVGDNATCEVVLVYTELSSGVWLRFLLAAYAFAIVSASLHSLDALRSADCYT